MREGENYTCCHCDRPGRSYRSHKTHEALCKNNPKSKIRSGISESTRAKLVESNSKRTHTQETKDAISAARKRYLESNPSQVPYLLNHHSKGPSYPEVYFKKVFENEGLRLVPEYRVGLYSLDFADTGLMVDVEINGEQHYRDPRVVASDVRRKAFLEARGWCTIEVRWAHYKKLDADQQKSAIAGLVDAIKSREFALAALPAVPPLEKGAARTKDERRRRAKKVYLCGSCGGPCRSERKFCGPACRPKKPMKINLSAAEIHLIWIEQGRNFRKTGFMLGISDNAIRKRFSGSGIGF